MDGSRVRTDTKASENVRSFFQPRTLGRVIYMEINHG